MALRDSLSSEISDDRKAAAAAAAGRSITGFSGRHTDAGDRFASQGDTFGPQIQPLIGERIRQMVPEVIGGEGPAEAPMSPQPERLPQPSGEQRERKPFGMQEQTLAYPPRPGFRRYWARDLPGRISRFKEAGYDHVRDGNGQPVSRITGVDSGRGQASYLMEIPNHWYQEDMARQAAVLAERLSAIKQGRAGADVTVENSYSNIKVTGR